MSFTEKKAISLSNDGDDGDDNDGFCSGPAAHLNKSVSQ
jgi:hypothetical protein